MSYYMFIFKEAKRKERKKATLRPAQSGYLFSCSCCGQRWCVLFPPGVKHIIGTRNSTFLWTRVPQTNTYTLEECIHSLSKSGAWNRLLESHKHSVDIKGLISVWTHAATRFLANKSRTYRPYSHAIRQAKQIPRNNTANNRHVGTVPHS